MTSSNTTFVFIPGGFCPGFYYHKVVAKLQSLGHEAIAVDLPSIGINTALPSLGLYEDSDYVRGIVTRLLDAGKDVVICGNSYGTTVSMETCMGLTEAERKAEGKQGGRIIHQILISSFLTEPGITIKDLLGSEMEMAPEVHPENPKYFAPMDIAIAGKVLFGSLPEEEQKYYGEMLKPMAMNVFLQPIRYAAFKHFPTTLVIGEKDIVTLPEAQEKHFDWAVKQGVKGLKKVAVSGGDHCVMISHPEEMAKICVEAAGM